MDFSYEPVVTTGGGFGYHRRNVVATTGGVSGNMQDVSCIIPNLSQVFPTSPKFSQPFPTFYMVINGKSPKKDPIF